MKKVLSIAECFCKLRTIDYRQKIVTLAIASMNDDSDALIKFKAKNWKADLELERQFILDALENPLTDFGCSPLQSLQDIANEEYILRVTQKALEQSPVTDERCFVEALIEDQFEELDKKYKAFIETEIQVEVD